ncbi:hypothetical protein GCM10029976_006650 [Kribbella albertanoniae]
MSGLRNLSQTGLGRIRDGFGGWILPTSPAYGAGAPRTGLGRNRVSRFNHSADKAVDCKRKAGRADG